VALNNNHSLIQLNILFFVSGIFDKNVSDSSVKAFQHFIGVVPSPPVYPDYQNFTDIVNHYLELPPFNFTNPLKEFGVPKIVSYFCFVLIINKSVIET